MKDVKETPKGSDTRARIELLESAVDLLKTRIDVVTEPVLAMAQLTLTHEKQIRELQKVAILNRKAMKYMLVCVAALSVSCAALLYGLMKVAG